MKIIVCPGCASTDLMQQQEEGSDIAMVHCKHCGEHWNISVLSKAQRRVVELFFKFGGKKQ